MPSIPIGSPDPVGSDPWVTGASLAGDHRLDEVDLPAAVTLDMCCESATDFLYQATGRRFRILARTEWPNEAPGTCGCFGGWVGPVPNFAQAGWWLGESWPTREVVLRGPVVAGSVVVTIDNVVLASSSYVLYDRERLVRVDGSYWPSCPHLATPTGGARWSIHYNLGDAPPMNGVLACRELAIHTALANSGKQSKIPARAAGISRGGVSMQLVRGPNRPPGRGGETRHLTGIPLVDDFIVAVNPHALTGRGSVMSPDTIRHSTT